MRPPPPIRFLALVIGGWVCLRAAILAPGWWQRIEPAAVATAAAPARAAVAARIRFAPPFVSPPRAARALRALRGPPGRPAPAPLAWRMPAAAAAGRANEALPAPPALMAAAGARPAARRWSLSAWLLVRDESGAAALAPGGTLGGSQAGARLLYRLGRGMALSARLYAPLRRVAGAEAALGLDWQPARLPLHLLAERRQGLGGHGRSAFALSLHGGFARALPHGPRIDAYGQAGLVGLRARDPFADGAVRVSVPLGPVEIGGGAWGGAQPGAARLDAGPRLSWRLPVRRASLRLEADWRFRLAGGAAPGSGPALTLAVDF